MDKVPRTCTVTVGKVCCSVINLHHILTGTGSAEKLSFLKKVGLQPYKLQLLHDLSDARSYHDTQKCGWCS